MSKTIKFYILEDPVTQEVRYVGKTIQSLKRRFKAHLNAKNKSYKNNWIKSLANKGLQPVMKVIEEIPYQEDWQWIECYWIEQFRAWGFNLTNMTDGGDGNNNQVFSQESFTKRSNSLKGRKRPKEVCERISKSKSGVSKPQEVKDKISETLTGTKQPIEVRRKRYKPVVQFDLDGTKLEEFLYLRKAAKAVNGNPGPISNVCKGRQKTAYGYKWQYKEDIV